MSNFLICIITALKFIWVIRSWVLLGSLTNQCLHLFIIQKCNLIFIATFYECLALIGLIRDKWDVWKHRIIVLVRVYRPDNQRGCGVLFVITPHTTWVHFSVLAFLLIETYWLSRVSFLEFEPEFLWAPEWQGVVYKASFPTRSLST